MVVWVPKLLIYRLSLIFIIFWQEYQMLRPHKLVQLCIYPKIYNILSFYSKGTYLIGISVIQESSDSKILRSFKPFIVSRSDIKISSSKKSSQRIISATETHEFLSQPFFVTYNEQSVFFNSLAIFKFEIDETNQENMNNSKRSRDRDKDTQIYVHLKLYEQKNKTVKVEPQDQDQKNTARPSENQNTSPNKKSAKPTEKTKVVKKLLQVDQRKLYLNKQSLDDINVYKRILFADSQYFSFIDLFIGSICLGYKLRLHSYGVSEFSRMDENAKINSHLLCLKLKEQNLQEDLNEGNMIHNSLRSSKFVQDSVHYGSQLLEFRKKINNRSQTALSSLRLRLRNLSNLSEHIQHDKSIKLQQSHPFLYCCLVNDLQIKNITNLKQLQDYYNTTQIEELYEDIYQQNCEFNRYLRGVWQAYVIVILQMGISPFSSFIHKNLIRQNKIKKHNAIIHEDIKEQVRKSHHQLYLMRRQEVIRDLLVIEEDDIYHPFFMLEGYGNCQENNKSKKQIQLSPLQYTSLVVYVHGYQGSDYDLQKAKNYMSLYDPKSYGLLIKSIQDDIDEDLQHLGQKVAEEIKNHLRMSTNNYKTINFLGYSLGGVIIREALRHLQEYKQKMNLLITFASPHLGVIKSDNALVGTGVWYLININKVKNLKQLNCQQIVIDEQNSSRVSKLSAEEEERLYSSFLEKLSNSKSLSWFKKMVVVSSKDDNFVPYYSSRIDANPSQYTSDERIIRMSENMLKRLKKIERMQVWFDVEHDINTFDKITGRRAHIEFLENRVFLDIFFRLYANQL